MQRLITRVTGRARDRVAGERGAVAVVVALLMVPLIGFAAVAVDGAAIYAERAQLQSGADAAALAIGQDCARGSCGDTQATAIALTDANYDSAGSEHGVPVVALSAGQVVVTNPGVKTHWFAPVIGHDSTAVNGRATVRWGAPESGTAAMPLTFSWCEFSQQTGGGMPSGTIPRTIYFTKTSGTTDCTGPSNNIVPGGFGYLETSGGRCEARSATSGRWNSSTGNSVPAPCTPEYVADLVGTTILLPIFDDFGGTGSGAWYDVYAYAAFHVTGYRLGGLFNTTPMPCSGSERCIRGYFTRLVDLSDAFTYGPDAPDLGARVVDLIR